MRLRWKHVMIPLCLLMAAANAIKGDWGWTMAMLLSAAMWLTD